MSYQALARKWRPRSFDDIVGQQHVVRALSNALDRNQLHHAYLFTGTRGVGKTTLARILSKALNCEQGVGSKPCGLCSACREIDTGRFVDLLEVDAASRTKVEQTRELLENVPYAPVRARFKVYLIDEVHMFSGHSFNALLKTLEEPPPHVKFLLATTDPQKIPVTVLSRCLQLNLRRLLPGEIIDRLRYVLEQEGLEFESTALPLLARAADGSLRDALSLLDQAIAFGGGRVVESETRAMLGTLSGDLALDILDALAEGDGAAVLDAVERVASMTPDFAELLRELIGLLHRLALIQQVPKTLGEDDPDRSRLLALAERLTPEDVQLFYQVALTGQTDLPLAPDPRSGLEMVLLRALAFRPGDLGARPTEASFGYRQYVGRPTIGGYPVCATPLASVVRCNAADSVRLADTRKHGRLAAARGTAIGWRHRRPARSQLRLSRLSRWAAQSPARSVRRASACAERPVTSEGRARTGTRTLARTRDQGRPSRAGDPSTAACARGRRTPTSGGCTDVYRSGRPIDTRYLRGGLDVGQYPARRLIPGFPSRAWTEARDKF